MEVYSNHDPALIVAYTIPIWIKGFIDYDGMWDGRELKSQIDSFRHFRFAYMPMEESQKRLSYIGSQVMKQYNIDKVIEVIKELTPEIVNTLIKKINVRNAEKVNGHKKVKIDIVFIDVGLISIPDEKN